jgi:NADPH:quinone reductase
VAHVVALDAGAPVDAIRAHAREGFDRIIEVAFSDRSEVDAAVAARDGIIAVYGTRDPPPELPFWSMLFGKVPRQ